MITDTLQLVFRPMAQFLRQDEGQDLIEYALLAFMVACAAVAAVGSVGAALGARFLNMSGTINGY